MPPTRSASKRAASRERSVEKGLPSLNELFPEDLFRGSFAAPPSAPSTSFTPLAVARADSQSHLPAPRPRSPSDAHPAARSGRRSPATIAARSHSHALPSPQALRGPATSPTPPPAEYNAPYPPPEPPVQQHVRSWRPPSGADREPERPVDLGQPSRYAHTSHREPLGLGSPRVNPPAGPSSALLYTMPPASGPASASPSHIPRSIQSPVDELVSALTRTGTRGPARREPARQHMPYGAGLSTAPAPTATHAPYYPHGPTGRAGAGAGGAANAAIAPGKARYPDSGVGLAGGVAGAGAARGKATTADDSERRHCCPHCNKRFNRPSSLAIHVNTHTGAKPFTCAFPGCNRKFNVNSNMRRHYRNHLTARRRDVVARMVQPLPSSVPHGAPGSALHPHMSLSPDMQSASIAGSGSPSISRSSSEYSPSPGSSRSPSPLPSPVSAVTSPFPPTPRSLPSTSFRMDSPARYASQHPLQPYYQHHQSYSQPPAAYPMPLAKQSSVRTLTGPATSERDGDQVMRAASPPWTTSEYEADELDGPAAQAESYVRGDRPAPQRVLSERHSSALWDRPRTLPRPRAESSPEMRRARPYPDPHDRPPRGLPVETLEESDSEGDEEDAEACTVPGCECAAGGKGTPRLRPAFQDVRAHHPSVSGWTVLEGASEDR